MIRNCPGCLSPSIVQQNTNYIRPLLAALDSMSAVEFVDIAAFVDFAEDARIDEIGRSILRKLGLPFRQMIEHCLNGALDGIRLGRHLRGIFPRFFQRLAIGGTEELAENAHSIFLAGLKQM